MNSKQTTTPETALILSDGGMKCAFAVGILIGLVQRDVSTWLTPDMCFAGSGSAGTATYLLTNQYPSITNIRTNLLTSRCFINPLRA